MTDYEALYADHDSMADHWWWRPGWHVGTRFYSWHITQDDQPEVRDLLHNYRDAIDTISTLDPVPDRWLHMTLQGVGHVSDVDPATLDSVTTAVADRLGHLAPVATTYQRVHISGEALILPPSDPEPFTDIRRAIRQGITDALGECPEADVGFRAHVSAAYSNASADAAPIRKVLDRAQPLTPVQATYTHVALIRMHRDHRMYEWDTIRSVPLG
ncbi:2'-5' RNA ligase family protein [Promicromonospora sp. Populi]|uniref:2'-5' RNA ligase family protein n=1 Tax=Promicromonospora sp. Populi TaxID=3239420 RepID=UPI0034E22F88